MLSGVPERSSGATAGGATQVAQRETDMKCRYECLHDGLTQNKYSHMKK